MFLLSLPMRGAWIEIVFSKQSCVYQQSRSPCGERGLKYAGEAVAMGVLIVAPHAGSVD